MSARRLLIEWACVVAVLCTLALALALSGATQRLDATLYDVAIRQAGRTPSPEIVIVGVDERSLARLGRWPWPRAVHAQLLAILTGAKAAAVGFDIIFSEPDVGDPDGDRRLSEALQAHGRAVLPLHMDVIDGRPRAVPPDSMFAHAAVGHVNSELDRDGVVRSVFLREGPGAARHPHIALAMLEAAGRMPAVLPGGRASRAPAPDVWARDYHFGIPFAGPPGAFRTVSYVEVLEGRVGRELFEGRLVLVGATAIGIKDMLPTPYAGHSAGMAGVEIVANVLDGLLQGREVRTLGPRASAFLALAVVLAVMLLFLRLQPRGSILAAGGTFLVVLAACVYGPRFVDAWVDPSAALIALVLAYPLWSWRRLQVTYDELRVEIDGLARESAAVAIARAGSEEFAAGADPVQRRMLALRAAGGRMRSLKRFLADALDGMTDALLVADADARVVVANARAGALFGRTSAADLLGRDLRALFSGWELPADFDPVRTGATVPVPLRKSDDRTFLWMATPCLLDDGVGTIVTLTDVTSFAVADARRREALGFLSHDLRAPLSGILAIVGLERARGGEFAASDAMARIETAARHAIAMADNFTAIARAEQVREQEFDLLDLRALCEEAVDVVHAPASARRIVVRLECDADEALVRGDAGVLRRAVVNLLQNSIQYGAADSRVDVTIGVEGGHWVVAVRDRGPGIPVGEIAHVFSRFRRGREASGRNPSGAGLGLALVRVVARVHRGETFARNRPDGGAELGFSIPVAADPTDADQRR